MNTKDTIYISGGEVKIVTLYDNLSPEFWMTSVPSAKVGRENPKSSRVALALGRLISRIKADLAARDGGPAFTSEEVLTRCTRKGERVQAEMLAGMVGGLVRWIQLPRKLNRRLKENRTAG